jgi:hypothetical protein
MGENNGFGLEPDENTWAVQMRFSLPKNSGQDRLV